MKTLIKEALEDCLSVTSIHGLPNIFKSKRVFHKLMWLVSFFVLCILCFYYEYLCIASFYDYKAVTQIQTFYEQPALFPAISFCSRNETYFNNISLRSLIKHCVFSYDKGCLNNSENYFESFYDSKGNQCYRFNSGKNLSGKTIPILSSTIGGRDDSFGLRIEAPQGLYIWVHNQSNPFELEKYNDLSDDMFLAGVKQEMQLVIERIFETKLEYPYNDCIKDVKDFKQNKLLIDFIINNKKKIYRHDLCIKYCFELYYLESQPCSCSNASLGSVWKTCFDTLGDCTFKYKTKFYQNSLFDKCSMYCPFECDTMRYSIGVNTIDVAWPDEVYLVVYYRSLKYTFSSQIPKMKLADIISNIGGIFGLFVGASFMSFIEFIQIISEILFILCQNFKKKIKIFKA